MTILEAENFYRNDTKEYDITNNKEFLKWFKSCIKNDYSYFTNVNDLSNMITKLKDWYEIKYPDRTFEYNDGLVDDRFLNICDISEQLSFDQLKYRLSHKELLLMECRYRSVLCGSYPKYDGTKIVGYKNVVGVRISSKDIDKVIMIKEETGMVDDSSLITFGLDKPFLIDELVNSKNICNSEIKKCVYNHDTDLELRKKVLELVSLNLLYSDDTIPEYGYFRSKMFIEDVNRNIPDINLSSDSIDEIINRDYSKRRVEKVEKQTKIKRKLFFKK